LSTPRVWYNEGDGVDGTTQAGQIVIFCRAHCPRTAEAAVLFGATTNSIAVYVIEHPKKQSFIVNGCFFLCG